MKKISKNDTIFIAGANGMAGQAIVRILKSKDIIFYLHPQGEN